MLLSSMAKIIPLKKLLSTYPSMLCSEAKFMTINSPLIIDKFLLLIAFIFLLKMSLFLISIMSTINSGSDYNLQSIIRERIKKEYIQKFWVQFKKELRCTRFDEIDWKPGLTKRLLIKMKPFRDYYYMKQQYNYYIFENLLYFF